MSNTEQSTNKLCLGCQQFFGNPANDNLCSSCFKKRMQANSTNNAMAAQQLPPAQISQAMSQLLASNEKPPMIEKIEEEQLPTEIVPPAEDSTKIRQEDHSRCWNCKKKVNLLGVKCKCDFTFCNKHRMPEDHACSYDHASFGRDLIKQNNPLVQKAKLEKI